MGRVRIALQKSGRLAQDSFALLASCGLHIDRSKDQLFCRIKELPIDLLLIRDDDIPRFVAQGICDLGIVGENVLAEQQGQEDSAQTDIVQRLGFSFCRLSIAAPEDSAVRSLADLEGKTVATSYPHLLQAALATRGVCATILTMNGSVEVAPRLKIADAICDIVASGATLAANNLREIEPLFESQAALIKNKAAFEETKSAIVDKLLGRIRGVMQAQDSKYIMLHAEKTHLPAIIRLLPGAEAPTVLPLQDNAQKVAVHAVCREAVFWETLEALKAAGASAILVLPIEKMMN